MHGVRIFSDQLHDREHFNALVVLTIRAQMIGFFSFRFGDFLSAPRSIAAVRVRYVEARCAQDLKHFTLFRKSVRAVRTNPRTRIYRKCFVKALLEAYGNRVTEAFLRSTIDAKLIIGERPHGSFPQIERSGSHSPEFLEKKLDSCRPRDPRDPRPHPRSG